MDILTKSTEGPGQVYWHQEDLTQSNLLLEDGANRDVYGFFYWICTKIHPDLSYIEYFAVDKTTGDSFRFEISLDEDLVSFENEDGSVWELTSSNEWAEKV